MQEMLLGLVRSDEHHALLGERSLASRLDTEEPFERVDAGARSAPVLLGLPFELGLHRLCHALAVREAELREHGAGGGQAEVLDEVLSQEPHRDRVEQQRALSREADHAAFGVELEKLFVIEIVGAHQRGHPFELKETGTSF